METDTTIETTESPSTQSESGVDDRRLVVLYEALRGILPYRAHGRACKVEMTEFCTCGLKRKADAAREAIRFFEHNDLTETPAKNGN